MTRPDPALLALADGRVWRGEACGLRGTSVGEVCFNTSLTGYQEILTDPSYRGQIVTLTAPHIGVTGANSEDDQSRRPWVAGLIVRDAHESSWSWRADSTLGEYLERHGVVAARGIDTRSLTRHIRSRGAMVGALSSVITDASELAEVARAAPRYEGRDLVGEVSISEPYVHEGPGASDEPKRVAAFDFGIKRNILDALSARGCEVTVMPARSSGEAVLDGGFDGVFLSPGPGDPEPLDYAVATVRSLLGRVPVFGICLGLQVLGLALGGRTYKLPFGHRGGNHPVKFLERDRIEITCQNHGFAVAPESLVGPQVRLTHMNLNDHTLEGFEIPGVCFGVQYHPEAGPGPHDSHYLFDRFMNLMDTFKPSSPLALESGAAR
jgi:carbamoyl-phosphate synthase small subunit